MCGIFALLNNNDTIDNENIQKEFDRASHRGPDNTIINLSNNNFLGFHRLKINGLDDDSNQPFIINNIMLICNGEIYNHESLFDNIKYKRTTTSDCEIIIYLYILYGIEYTLNLLDGVFAFILLDYDKEKIYVCRDVYGVRPLYYLFNESSVSEEYQNNNNKDSNMIAFSSELKQLIGIYNKLNTENNGFIVNQFIPSEYMEFSFLNNKWFLSNKVRYNSFKINKVINLNSLDDKEEYLNTIYYNIFNLFIDAVKKRVANTDRPIACLLSGGLDSSIVTSIVSKFYQGELETYSIGLENSEDLLYAKKVANFLNTKHTEIIVSEDDFFNSIPTVIEMIESYDTTTVRASVGNYLVSKYISENSDAKVIFNGDGSDELMGGYLYMKECPNHYEFDLESKRLLQNIYLFDALRSDKSISTNGLEPRTPFLDREFVDYYLSIPSNIRFKSNKIQEKILFRKSFYNKDFLPDEILFRKKEAFSDGVSSLNKSWYAIIGEKVKNQKDVIINYNKNYDINPPKTIEQLYYRTIFENLYPNVSYVVPYFWMPKYVNSKDPSARTLEVYDKENDLKNIVTLNNSNLI